MIKIRLHSTLQSTLIHPWFAIISTKIKTKQFQRVVRNRNGFGVGERGAAAPVGDVAGILEGGHWRQHRSGCARRCAPEGSHLGRRRCLKFLHYSCQRSLSGLSSLSLSAQAHSRSSYYSLCFKIEVRYSVFVDIMRSSYSNLDPFALKFVSFQ